MKTIELKKTKESILFNGKSVEMDFYTADLIRTAVNQPVKGGYTTTDLVNRIRIADKLEEANRQLTVEGNAKLLELEDSDYKNLSALVAEARWPVVSKTILEFVESFKK